MDHSASNTRTYMREKLLQRGESDSDEAKLPGDLAAACAERLHA